MADTLRIGVFGGTFDPVHNTHIAIARAAMRSARLDRVLFVVAGCPPHKQGGEWASSEDRYAMVAAALKDHPGMEPCRIEIDRQGPSYTADTLRALKEQSPGAEFFLILGMDSLVDLPHWRAPSTILKIARILVAPRPGQWDIPSCLDGHYDVLSIERVNLSSTEIRERIEKGRPVTGLLPDAVLEYIEDRGIYRD